MTWALEYAESNEVGVGYNFAIHFDVGLKFWFLGLCQADQDLIDQSCKSRLRLGLATFAAECSTIS
jgi:hypothetical protein